MEPTGLGTTDGLLVGWRAGEAAPSGDGVFTLVELMVVLLILAILLAIAIPTFLGVTGNANDRASQSNLNTALYTAKGAATRNGQSYTGVSTSSLASNEPTLSFVTGSTTTQGQVSVFMDTNGNGVILASPSKNAGGCWYVVDNLAAITTVSGNGLYLATGQGAASTTSAPTNTGTFYGYQTGSACQANATTIPSGIKWASSFGLA